MRLVRWFVPLIATVLIFSGVGLVSAQEAVGSVSGKITDAKTGEAIPGALVELGSADLLLTAVSGEDGTYHIADVPMGEYHVSASADGYEGETETGVGVSEGEDSPQDFALQPEDAEDDGAASNDANVNSAHEGPQAGSRKGYVGTFTLGVTGAPVAEGFFAVVTKKGDTVEILIPTGGLLPISRTPGRKAEGNSGRGGSAGTLGEGAEVAVLVEFVEHEGETVPQALRILVKPAHEPPLLGINTGVHTNENGVRILTIMRPDGTSKKVRLGRGVDAPGIGEHVIAFPRRGHGQGAGDEDADGPPEVRGLVRAQQVRERLEGFINGLTADNGNVPEDLRERRAQRLHGLAAVLEKHAAQHVTLLERLSKKTNLRPQVLSRISSALQNAQLGRSRAQGHIEAARDRAESLFGRGRADAQGQQHAPDSGRGRSDAQGQQHAPAPGAGVQSSRDLRGRSDRSGLGTQDIRGRSDPTGQSTQDLRGRSDHDGLGTQDTRGGSDHTGQGTQDHQTQGSVSRGR